MLPFHGKKIFISLGTETKKNTIDDSDGINPCQTVDVPLWICQTYWLSQVLFSCFFLVWNGVVAMVLVSVSRTHTVSIRRYAT